MRYRKWDTEALEKALHLAESQLEMLRERESYIKSIAEAVSNELKRRDVHGGNQDCGI